jgi:FkbM family methyltransferase
MNLLESVATRLRHLPGLNRLAGLWAIIRPWYQKTLNWSSGEQGLVRIINGLDEIRILPEWRALPETYEPEVWSRLLPSIQKGDVIADVGAHYGIYAIAFAKRTGPTGKVFAIEADSNNAKVLSAHVRLNQVEHIVEIVQKAVADREGSTDWHSQDTQSVLKPSALDGHDSTVQMTTLDRLLEARRLDVMLIDIEGYEEPALRGGLNLLNDCSRRPRLIVVEVHPYNWELCGSSSASFLRLLNESGYDVTGTDGQSVSEIRDYGHVFATPKA